MAGNIFRETSPDLSRLSLADFPEVVYTWTAFIDSCRAMRLPRQEFKEADLDISNSWNSAFSKPERFDAFLKLQQFSCVQL